MSNTLPPAAAIARARPIAVVVLPSPGTAEVIATTRIGFAASANWIDVRKVRKASA